MCCRGISSVGRGIGFLQFAEESTDIVPRILRIVNFKKGPAPENAVVVDGRHLQRARRGDLSLFFCLPRKQRGRVDASPGMWSIHGDSSRLTQLIGSMPSGLEL